MSSSDADSDQEFFDQLQQLRRQTTGFQKSSDDDGSKKTAPRSKLSKQLYENNTVNLGQTLLFGSTTNFSTNTSPVSNSSKPVYDKDTTMIRLCLESDNDEGDDENGFVDQFSNTHSKI